MQCLLCKDKESRFFNSFFLDGVIAESTVRTHLKTKHSIDISKSSAKSICTSLQSQLTKTREDFVRDSPMMLHNISYTEETYSYCSKCFYISTPKNIHRHFHCSTTGCIMEHHRKQARLIRFPDERLICSEFLQFLLGNPTPFSSTTVRGGLMRGRRRSS